MATKKLSNINSLLAETSCGSLLRDLQVIWDEVGEEETERDKMLLQLEEECLDVYRRKVDQANLSRARMHQLLADSQSELAHLVSVLGETSAISRLEKHSGSLKEQLAAIEPTLAELRKKRDERLKQFKDVEEQIQRISSEIAGNISESHHTSSFDEQDLSLKNLDEFHVQLQGLHREKNERLQKVLDYVDAMHTLSRVMGLEFSKVISEVHPSLARSQRDYSKSINDVILSKLASRVESLKQEKEGRLRKIQKLGTTLLELWNLIGTSLEEQRSFDHITRYVSSSVAEITMPRALSLEIIDQAECEVKRLDQLKSSKLKELFLRKQRELQDIYRNAHMEIGTYSTEEKYLPMIESGSIDHSQLLASMDDQIAKAKEEAFSRREIMEKVEKWMTACEEESWLEEYNRDENRYTVSRGAHKNLKRAEKARIIVNKIPALVESLMAKTRAWEEERRTTFYYDDVPLLAMLDEYNMLRHERDEEKKRHRDKKKLQGQLTAEKEAYFGSRPSLLNQVQMKNSGHHLNGNSLNGGSSLNRGSMSRRLSLGVNKIAANGHNTSRPGFSAIKDTRREHSRPVTPLNYFSVQRQDSSHHSACSVPSSP